jgi:chromosome segregation ATPase
MNRIVSVIAVLIIGFGLAALDKQAHELADLRASHVKLVTELEGQVADLEVELSSVSKDRDDWRSAARHQLDANMNMEAIWQDNLADLLHLQHEVEEKQKDLDYVDELNAEIQISVKAHAQALEGIATQKLQGVEKLYVGALANQEALEVDIDRLNDNHQYQVSVLRDDLDDARGVISQLNDDLAKAERRESELAEQLSLSRKVLSMIPRSTGVRIH